jgi:hypothetical protein
MTTSEQLVEEPRELSGQQLAAIGHSIASKTILEMATIEGCWTTCSVLAINGVGRANWVRHCQDSETRHLAGSRLSKPTLQLDSNYGSCNA